MARLPVRKEHEAPNFLDLVDIQPLSPLCCMGVYTKRSKVSTSSYICGKFNGIKCKHHMFE
jgi:hypothetical protein